MSAKPIKVQRARSYFWSEVSLNKDIERHRQHEKELRDKIKEIESSPDSEFRERHLSTYRRFLDLLLQSKAEVVSKIGRK